MPDDGNGFEQMFAALASSRAYRAAVDAASLGLPAGLLPYSRIDAAIVERAIRALQVNAGAVLVDVGCGFGAGGLAIVASIEASLIGVDIAPSALVVAERTARERGLDARFMCATAEQTGLDAACADGIVCFDALMFVDAERTIREMARFARAGARVVATASEWIAAGEPPIPTVVRAYAPFFTAAGFAVEEDELIDRAPGDALFAAIAAHADALSAEHGDVVRPLIDEARSRIDGSRMPRVRDRWIVARKLP